MFVSIPSLMTARKGIAAGQSFLINEDFEGTGAPAGWGAGGGADFDSTVSPLQGAQSLRCAASTTAPSPGFNEGEIYVKSSVRFSNLPASEVDYITMVTASTALFVYVKSTAVLGIYDGASTVAETSGTISAGTIYDIEAHYKKGSGSDGIISIAFVTQGGSIPTSGPNFASSSSSTRTDNVTSLTFSGASTVTNTDFDVVKVSTTFIS